MKIKIDEFEINTNIEFDSFFVSKVKNFLEIKNLLENTSLPSFLTKSLPIIKNLSKILDCNSYNLNVYYNYMLPSSYINISLSANIDEKEKSHIGYFFFNNYLNKQEYIYIDINLDIINDKNHDFIPQLNKMPDNSQFDLEAIKIHIENIFNTLNSNDFYLEFNQEKLKDKNNNKIITAFDNKKEILFYKNIRENHPIIKNNISEKFNIFNIINDNGVFKMIEFNLTIHNTCEDKANKHYLTLVFNSLTHSIEDSFIRGLIYEEFFNSTVINRYIEEKMSLHEMLELQNITEY